MSETARVRPAALRDASACAAWRELHRAASDRYRRAGRFAHGFAHAKLGRDPVFRGLLERGDLVGARVVDLGCGQGLLASLLQSCRDRSRAGRWPPAWPPAPQATAYTGIELMPRDVARAERALADSALALRLVCADLRSTPLPACDLVVGLDVLHYIEPAAQFALLQRVGQALQPHGRLLLRVGDRASRRGFHVSQWVDRAVAALRGYRTAPRFGRSVAEWTELLAGLGFRVRAVPMHAGTPFANVLLIADKGAGMAPDRDPALACTARR